MKATLLTAASAAALLGLAPAAFGQAQAPAQQGQQAQAQQPQAQRGQAQQGQQAQGQTQAAAGSAYDQYEQALREARTALAAPEQARQQQGVTAARDALQRLSAAVQRAPTTGPNAVTPDMQRELREAQEAVTAPQFNQQRVLGEIDQVIVLLPRLRPVLAGVTPDAAGATVTIRESPDRVVVQQAAPDVRVQQPAPQITVVVPQPEIIVRQPPPQVTVQMPPPQVAVQQGQPQVRVVEAQPQVQVQPARPDIAVQQAQPQVRVVQQGQPQVRFEQLGQAQVRVEEAPGAVAERDRAAVPPAAAPGATAVTPPPGAPPVTGAPAVTPPAVGGGATPAAAGIPLVRATSLIGTNLIGAGGRDAGEVENLLIDRQGNVRAAVVEWGGFLGIGERRAVVPIEQIQFGAAAGERARLALTREQLEALPAYDRNRLGDYGTRYGWGEGVRLYR